MSDAGMKSTMVSQRATYGGVIPVIHLGGY